MGHITSKDAYKNLEERINWFTQGAPPTESLYKILQVLYTEKEAKWVALLPVRPFTAKKAAKIWNTSEGKAEAFLEHLCEKALLVDSYYNGVRQFVMPPPMAGFIEFALMRTRGDIDQKYLSELYYQYMNVEEDFVKDLFFATETYLGRVYVQEPVLTTENTIHILDYERASHIIEEASHIGLGTCYCRHKMLHAGHPCEIDAPLDVCLTFGNVARSLSEHGHHARLIDKKEAMDVLERSYAANLVQIGENVREDPAFICNCCGCCCEALQAARKFSPMQPVATTNYIPNISNECIGCGKCAKVCPVLAIVSAIGDDAFAGCDELTTIILPNGLTKIGQSAFYNCDSLNNVTIPVNVTEIGGGAFKYCDALSNFTINSSVLKTTGYSIFESCPNLTTVKLNGNLTKIPDEMFMYADSITNITLPSTVKEIGEDSFSNCDKLTTVILPNGLTTINAYGFSYNPLLTNISLPSSLKTIGRCAFYKSTALKSVTIPQNVTSIGYSAFAYCSSLKSFTVNSSVLTSVDGNMLYDCSSLETVTINGNLKKIPDNMFNYANYLKSITIPSSVTEIGYRSFAYCTNLSNITLSKNLTKIGLWAFSYCTSLKSITIPSKVTSMSSSPLYGCSALSSIRVESGAIAKIYDFDLDGTPLKTIYGLTDSVVEAYAKNNKIKFISIGYATPALNKIYTVSNLKYKVTKSAATNGTVSFAGVSNTKLTNVTIPSTVKINGYTLKVTGIIDNALKSNSKITQLTIGSNVTSIGKTAFQNCTKLKTINIKTSSLKTIGSNAFKGIYKKATIKVPSNKLTAYKKLLKGKGQASSVIIKK